MPIAIDRWFDLVRDLNVASGRERITATEINAPKCVDADFRRLQMVRRSRVVLNAGLVVEGKMYFRMIQECGLELKVNHYGCMVELFGRMDMLEEALEMIEDMKVELNVVVWGSYLSACKQHKQFDVAEHVIVRVLGMIKPENDGGVYTLICNLDVLCQKWDDAERDRQLMLDRKVRKVRGSSSVDGIQSLLGRRSSERDSYFRLLYGESEDKQASLRKMIFDNM